MPIMPAMAAILPKDPIVASVIPKSIRDPSKYNIIDLKTVKYVERDEFIKRISGPLESSEVDLALALITRQTQAGASFQDEFIRLANTYDTLRRTEARLPKFSRWVTSLYPKRAELAAEFARLGQKMTNDVYEVSGDVVDILRCADTPHFASCFKAGGFSQDIPKQIAERATGVCIVFADDAAGKMKSRTWGVHVRDPKGNDALMLGSGRYGVMDVDTVGKKIAEKYGIDVYRTGGGYQYPPPPKSSMVKLETVSGINAALYFDFPIWGTVEGTKLNK
jgi:hypothetical protein